MVEKVEKTKDALISVTEVTFEKDIFFKCRTKLNEIMEENNVNYGWLDMGGFVSLNYGTHRLAKFRLKQ